METKLSFQYDREADILYINKRAPHAGQESEELGDEVVARWNPKTREVETLEILFFSSRLAGDGHFDVPVEIEIRLPARS